MSMPFGDSGSGTGTTDSASIGSDQQTSGGSATLADSQQQSPQVTDSSGSGNNINPAWKDVLDKVPTQFHSVFTPKLKEWDQNYQQLARDYAPYKQFSQQGVKAETLQQAMTLYNLIDQNPQEIYRRLGEALGQFNQQVQQQGQQDQEQEFDYSPDEEDPQDGGQQQEDPRFVQMMQQMQMLQDQNNNFQQQYLTNQYSQQIDAEIKGLVQQHGQFDVQDVMNRFLAQMQRGEDPSITKAYQEQQTFIQNWQAAHQKAPAPQVLSPNGGMPTGQEQIPLKTQDDRVAAVKRMLTAQQE